MKKLIIILMLIAPFKSFCQTQTEADSLKFQMKNMMLAFNTSSDYLHRGHQEHTVGVIFSAVGLLATAGAIFLKDETHNTDAIAVGGIIINVIGMITIWDSHKWIGSAGEIRVNPTGISYHF